MTAQRRQGMLPVWLMGGITAVCCLGVLGMVVLLSVRGLVYFWPSQLVQFQVVELPGDEAVTVAGRLQETERVTAEQLRSTGAEIPQGVQLVTRWLVKIGNREINGLDFWPIAETSVVTAPGQTARQAMRRPERIAVLERRSWGDFYGYPTALSLDGGQIAHGEQAWQQALQRLPEVTELLHQARRLERSQIYSAVRRLEKARQRARTEGRPSAEQQRLQLQYRQLEDQLRELRAQAGRYRLLMRTAGGEQADIPLAEIVRAYRPNQMGLSGQFGVFFSRLWEFLSEEPREANTEGGVFPAIFGTVTMVLLMTVLVMPFGVAAAFYLREYSRQGPIVRIIRISINNLAGVPSIVFGIFGLGFFVYGLGGKVDELLFSARLPNPTFGTPGLFWASLTMALLTLPVVVVATEEGLTRVPNNIRHGALALGATRFEMLTRTVFPMAVPGILTGLILAIARAAGEVAPLVLVGAVKFAPTLPLTAELPYLHLERKFMHLGYHIYDAGFQSPNAEAAQPLVYATALLLVTIILILNLSAMMMRNRYRERFIALEV